MQFGHRQLPMKKIISSSVAAYVLSGLFASSAYAYVDPGTSSMAIELIVAGLIAAVFMLAFAIKKYFFKNIKKNEEHDSAAD